MKTQKMMLYNITKKREVIGKTLIAESIFRKSVGLLGRRKADFALVFPFGFSGKMRLSIHTFFMLFSIDVLWLRNGKVVDMRENLRPFVFFAAPKEDADTIIELPAGTARRTGTGIGDLLAVAPKKA